MKKQIIKAIIVWLTIVSIMMELCAHSESLTVYFIWTVLNIYLVTLINHIPYEELKKYTGYTFMEKLGLSDDE